MNIIIERKIPNLKFPILRPLSFDDELTEEQYIEKIETFERSCEKRFIFTCRSLGIYATVKSDPYSLPYTDEIVVNLHGSSFLNGAYEFERVSYKIMKKILDKDIYQFRFYIFINVKTDKFFGSVEYRFRYYKKN